MSLDSLLQRSDIWRGGNFISRQESRHSVSSGDPRLDAQLPGGGWPLGALTELLLDQTGIGELQLLIPALAKLTKQGHWLAWISPPYLPYAPALANSDIDLSRFLVVSDCDAGEALWAMEQALRSGVCGAVLGWMQVPRSRDMRRLQLAAETGNAMGVLFRPQKESKQASPAALRMQLRATDKGLIIQIIKRRGAWATSPMLWESRHRVMA